MAQHVTGREYILVGYRLLPLPPAWDAFNEWPLNYHQVGASFLKEGLSPHEAVGACLVPWSVPTLRLPVSQCVAVVLPAAQRR